MGGMATTTTTRNPLNIAHVSATSFSIEVSITTATVEAAQALAARFPKSAAAKAIPTHTFEGEPGTPSYVPNITLGSVHVSVRLKSDKVNGGYNEAGVRRYRAARKTIAALGLPVEWRTPFTNSWTEEQLEQQIAVR